MIASIHPEFFPIPGLTGRAWRNKKSRKIGRERGGKEEKEESCTKGELMQPSWARRNKTAVLRYVIQRFCFPSRFLDRFDVALRYRYL